MGALLFILDQVPQRLHSRASRARGNIGTGPYIPTCPYGKNAHKGVNENPGMRQQISERDSDECEGSERPAGQAFAPPCGP